MKGFINPIFDKLLYSLLVIDFSLDFPVPKLIINIFSFSYPNLFNSNLADSTGFDSENPTSMYE